MRQAQDQVGLVACHEAALDTQALFCDFLAARIGVLRRIRLVYLLRQIAVNLDASLRNGQRTDEPHGLLDLHTLFVSAIFGLVLVVFAASFLRT